MLIFIENTPRTYAWGSRDALPELLGVEPTGEPQAELWLGAHPGAPASLTKARAKTQTLIELIESDPDRYGVDGAQLPFLLKVLAIGAPLSLQVHPDLEQARRGFEREEAAGVRPAARERNYRDPNHKPELLVALGQVTALCGFRPLARARQELLALAAVAPSAAGAGALAHAATLCEVPDEHEMSQAGSARRSLLEWALSDAEQPVSAVAAIAEIVRAPATSVEGVEPLRIWALERLTSQYPGDAGVLISLLLHLVRLQPGEAISLSARQLHAYLDGIAVEVMAASDNVLRAGFTDKHVDTDELLQIVDFGSLDSPRLESRQIAPGLVAWQPPVPDFCLMRVGVRDARPESAHDHSAFEMLDDSAESVAVEAHHPLVLLVTHGRIRVDRIDGELEEFAIVGRGQSIYVSAGEPIEVTGQGEAFLATVGESWSRVSQLSSHS